IYPLREVAPVASTGVLYLLAVLLVSTYWGLRLGVVAALASAAAFNWFHLPPTGRFTVSDPANWVALGVLLTAALIASTLAERARVAPPLAALVAAALDRDRLQAEVVETAALRRSDVIKTALLRAVSHDLRTPLTSIIAAADAVRSPTMDADEREELAALIVDE